MIFSLGSSRSSILYSFRSLYLPLRCKNSEYQLCRVKNTLLSKKITSKSCHTSSLTSVDSRLNKQIYIKSALPELVDESQYPEDLLPSQKQKRRELVLYNNIYAANSSDDVFLFLNKYESIVTGQHLAVAHFVIGNFVLNSKVDPNELKKNQLFEKLCRHTFHQCRSMEVAEVAMTFRGLVCCQIDVNSTILQCIMQVLRNSLHLCDLGNLAMISDSIHNMSTQSNLSRALKHAVSLQVQRLIKFDLLSLDEVLKHHNKIIGELTTLGDIQSLAYIIRNLCEDKDNLSIHEEYNITLFLMKTVSHLIRGPNPENKVIKNFIWDFINRLADEDVSEVVNEEMRDELLHQLVPSYNKLGFHPALHHLNVLQNITTKDISTKKSLTEMASLCSVLDELYYLPRMIMPYICQLIQNSPNDLQPTERIAYSSLLSKSFCEPKNQELLYSTLNCLLELPWDQSQIEFPDECKILLGCFGVNYPIPNWLHENIFTDIETRISKYCSHNTHPFYINKLILLLTLLKDYQLGSEDQLLIVTKLINSLKSSLSPDVRNTPLKRTLQKIFLNSSKNIESGVIYRDYIIDHLIAVDKDTLKLSSLKSLDISNNIDLPENIALIAVLDLQQEFIIGAKKIPYGIPLWHWLKGNILRHFGFEVIYLSSSVIKRASENDSASHVRNQLYQVLKKYEKNSNI